MCKANRRCCPQFSRRIWVCVCHEQLSVVLWGWFGSAPSQAQRQPGPGKVIRGDKALCTHSLFGIQADPRVSSWAAFPGAEPELMVSAHPAVCPCSLVLLPCPQHRAGTSKPCLELHLSHKTTGYCSFSALDTLLSTIHYFCLNSRNHFCPKWCPAEHVVQNLLIFVYTHKLRR